MVEDNGVGIDPQALPNLLTQDSGGYGIKNVHERIQLYYGKEFGLTLESKLSVGTRATLTIPARRNSTQPVAGLFREGHPNLLLQMHRGEIAHNDLPVRGPSLLLDPINGVRFQYEG